MIKREEQMSTKRETRRGEGDEKLRAEERQREKVESVAFGWLPGFFSYAMLNNDLAYKRLAHCGRMRLKR